MPRSYGALKVSVWEAGSDFRRLSLPAQWAYVMLISQPQLNNLGLLPFVPEKWVRFADGLDRQTLDDLLDELATERYILVDATTDELLVRTFIKHDKVWAQPKLITNARKLIREVESDRLREHLGERHPWLLDDRPKAEIEAYEAAVAETPIETPTRTPTRTPIETPSDTHIPTRAPAGPGPGPGVGTSAVDVESKAAEVSEGAAAASLAELDEVLDDLAIPGSLREKAHAEPERALDVARYTIANKGTGAYFRTVFESGDWPSTNGRTPTDPAERRRAYVEKTGYLLPDDELEYQLREKGADSDEITGHLETAYDLRAGAAR